MQRLTIILVLCAILSVAMSVSERNSIQPCNFPRCRIACPFGYQRGPDGCAICKCKRSPCGEGIPPLHGHFCGGRLNSGQCPETHTCVSLSDRPTGVCCPRTSRRF